MTDLQARHAGASTSPVDRTATVDGVDVALLDYGGDGPPLVLLHGGGRTAGDWHMAARDLSKTVRVVTVDFRGHGRSGRVPSWSYLDGIADLTAVVDQLGLVDPVVGGHSLGGMVSSLYAAGGGACRAVINVDGHGAGHPSLFEGIDPDEVAAALARFAEESKDSFESTSDRGDTAWVEAELDTWREPVTALGMTWDEAEPMLRRGYRDLGNGQWERSPNTAVNQSMYESIAGLDLLAAYRSFTVPALIYRSRHDELEGDAEKQRLIGAFNRGLDRQLAELEAENPMITLDSFDTGHMIPLEAPAELARRMAAFIEGLAASAPSPAAG